MFKAAEYYENEHRFEEALRRYTELRKKFPYSQWATEAELKIADVYFKQESYPEAYLAYQNFRELHPLHPKSDYVLYCIGLSLYHQLPETYDRDLSLAPQTLEIFTEFIQNYPNSSYLNDVKMKYQEVDQKIIDKIRYIADFYFKRQNYVSALERYQSLLLKAAKDEDRKWALIRARMSAKKVGNIELEKKFEKKIKVEYPDVILED